MTSSVPGSEYSAFAAPPPAPSSAPVAAAAASSTSSSATRRPLPRVLWPISSVIAPQGAPATLAPAGHNIDLLGQIFFYLNRKDRETAAGVETHLGSRCDQKAIFPRLAPQETHRSLALRMNHNQKATWRELGEYHDLANDFFSSPEILHVDLSGFQGRNWENIFDTLFTSFPNLKSLNLKNCLLTDADVIKLAQKFPHLQRINLEFAFGITDAAIRELVQRCPDLRSLCLAVTPITDNTLNELTKTCKNLQYLNLSGCGGITDAGMRELPQRCPNLRRLIIGYTRITAPTVQWLLQSLPNLTVRTYKDERPLLSGHLSLTNDNIAALRTQSRCRVYCQMFAQGLGHENYALIALALGSVAALQFFGWPKIAATAYCLFGGNFFVQNVPWKTTVLNLKRRIWG